MLIALVKYPVTTLGPGKRIGIWTAGCNKKCKGCMSSFSKQFDSNKNRDIPSLVDEIKDILGKNNVNGVTISGGEPFDQGDLIELLVELKKLNINDVLVFTGYFIGELTKKREAFKYIDVLIDGPYVEELNDNKPLRGSSNQNIYIFNRGLKKKYLSYLELPRKYEITIENGVATVIGIIPKGDYDVLSKIN